MQAVSNRRQPVTSNRVVLAPLRRRWSKAGPGPANWIALGLTLFLGVALAHLIYVWIYPYFPRQIRVAIDVITLCLAASILFWAALQRRKEVADGSP